MTLPTRFRIVSTIVLAAFLAGCSGYSRVAPTSHASGGFADPVPVEVGQKVRVRLADGGVVEGRLARVGEHELVVEVGGGEPPAQRTIALDEVAELWKKQVFWVPTTVVSAVAVAGAVLVIGTVGHDGFSADDGAK